MQLFAGDITLDLNSFPALCGIKEDDKYRLAVCNINGDPVFYLGFVYEQKRLQELIRSFAILKARKVLIIEFKKNGDKLEFVEGRLV